MAFEIRTRQATAGGTSGTVYELANTEGTARAEVWPAFGFNCLRWQVARSDGALGDLLFCDPSWEQNPVATRSGHPILFPFPNRMKHGRFTYAGREYQLPLNESTGLHAIHGFTPKTPWRVVDQSADSEGATIVGEFRLSADRPDLAQCWPGDLGIRIEYLLAVDGLSVNATVTNHGSSASPFGLGFHPYFACPNAPDASADEMLLDGPASALWEAVGAFPTGRTLELPAGFDFRDCKPLGAVALDTLFEISPRSGIPMAALGHRTESGRLTVFVDDAFRKVLLFTPPHRKAVAIEPYTCTTDAANLAASGVECGWRELAPGQFFRQSVRYRWDANSRG